MQECGKKICEQFNCGEFAKTITSNLDITLQDKLNQVAVRLQYQMRSLVPLQMELIEQQQELYDRAVAMFDGVVEDETQQDLFNILMGVANNANPIFVHRA